VNPEARAFAIEAARALADDRCHQVTILDVAGVSPVTDFFVIATGTSARQMRTAVDSIEELGKGKGHTKLSRSGDESASWIILDCFDVVVHCFTQEARSYYDLDGMWGDARRVEWEPLAPANPAK
jgi:ribosome-associated protein